MKERGLKKFLITEGIFSIAVFAATFQGRLRSYNSTMLSLSYRNGFTSRALLGTIYHLIDAILPGDMINYSAAVGFGVFSVFLMIPFLLIFSGIILSRVKEEAKRPAEVLLLLLILITVSTYSNSYNFLRVDMFMLLTSLIAASLLITERAAFLCIPLSVIGVMLHQGFVFMYFNIILITLLFLFMKAGERKERIRYGAYTVLSFVLSGAFFLYFELFSRNSGEEVYETVKAEAKALSYKGIYHTTLLAHEVLGIDLDEAEIGLRKVNHLQTPVYILFMLPFIIILVRFMIRLIKNSDDNRKRIMYFFFAAGSLTMVPSYILKCDYGRWILSTVTYYITSTLILLSLGDDMATEEVCREGRALKNKPYAYLIPFYICLFIPFLDVDINETLKHAQDILSNLWPGIWDLV